MSLRRAIENRTRNALSSGALEPIPSRIEIVEDRKARFVVRVVESFASKPRARKLNPFLPYDEALFVTEVSHTHVALLNKFNVLPIHLLVVTRNFEEQQSLLNQADFEAMWRLMPELDGLFFYNAGPEAGASQRHKHLQLVSLPLGEGPEKIPLDPWRSELPFVRAVAKLGPYENVHEAATRSRKVYLRLLDRIGPKPSQPYNLLMTANWMCVVARSQHSWKTISVNALGFAGALLARNESELVVIREEGPFSILEHVGWSLHE